MLSLLKKPYAPPRGPIARLRRRSARDRERRRARRPRAAARPRGLHRPARDDRPLALLADRDRRRGHARARRPDPRPRREHEAPSRLDAGRPRRHRPSRVRRRRQHHPAGHDDRRRRDRRRRQRRLAATSRAGTVAVGNPAREVGRTEDYVARHRAGLAERPRFPWQGWTLTGGISEANKQRMRDALLDGEGYVE